MLVAALRSQPVVVARRDVNRSWIDALEKSPQKLTGICRHPVVLEQVATAANQIDALIGSKPDTSGKGITESLPSSSGDLGFCPRKRCVEMYV
jgi:hypothetical protein